MQDSCRRISFVKSRMRKSRTSGSVRGIPCKGYVYPNLPQLLYIGFKLIPQIPYKIGV